MSDKSFGDYNNRNLMKNPLLSTAVTGLSIEDLTQNAVLLPVVPTQGLMLSQDQTGSQNATLENSPRDTANFPSGDANFNTVPLESQTITNLYTSQSQQIHNDEKTSQMTSPTVSNALTKSEDDFDVNEYFARLHGTRYVSAPLNIKDDQNANLEPAEDNLEEINLNDSNNSRESDDTQQSITADIAQNFSQLPTVLPQVASAVFNSFSNMLYKSRESTPDVRPNIQEVKCTKTQEYSPFMTTAPIEEVKELAPPPKEPPVGGIANYRITTKKKAYAHIPGLSSNEATHNTTPAFIPNFSQSNMPSYFVPNVENSSATPNIQNIPDSIKLPQNIGIQSDSNNACFSSTSIAVSTVNINLDQQDKPTKNEEYDVFQTKTEQPESSLYQQMDVTFNPAANNEALGLSSQSSSSIIPPPPMFCNIPKRDSQASVAKSLLPPSVARRISAHQPVIKTQTEFPTIAQNIFIPAPTETHLKPLDVAAEQTRLNSNRNTTIAPPTMFFPMPQSLQPTQSTSACNTTDSSSSTTSFSDNFFQPVSSSSVLTIPSVSSVNLPAVPTNSQESINQGLQSIPTSSLQLVSSLSSINLPVAPMNSQESLVQNESLQSKSFIPQSTLSQSSLRAEFSEHTSSLFIPSTTPRDVLQITSSTDSGISLGSLNVLPPTIYNSNLMQGVPGDSSVKETSYIPTSSIINPSESVAKSLPEPPKLSSSNLSYRMTKKRPQYYAGPIDGVGSIRNNLKPYVDPINTHCYSGTLFTPSPASTSIQHPQSEQKQPITPFDLTKVSEGINHELPTNVYSNQLNTRSQDYIDNSIHNSSDNVHDSYNSREEEPKSYGIIGSLKSKLSSIQISQIQKSVTTFFDPAYNDINKQSSEHESVYPNKQQEPAFGAYDQTELAFDIIVPNSQSRQPEYQNQDVRTANQNYPLNYNNQYYESPDSSVNVNQLGYPNYPVSSYFTNFSNNSAGVQNINTAMPVSTSNNDMATNIISPVSNRNITLYSGIENSQSDNVIELSSNTNFDRSNLTESKFENIIGIENQQIDPETNLKMQYSFESNEYIHPEELSAKLRNMQLNQETAERTVSDDSNTTLQDYKPEKGFFETNNLDAGINSLNYLQYSDSQATNTKAIENNTTIEETTVYKNQNTLPSLVTAPVDINAFDNPSIVDKQENLSEHKRIESTHSTDYNIFDGMTNVTDKLIESSFFSHNLSTISGQLYGDTTSEYYIENLPKKASQENQIKESIMQHFEFLDKGDSTEVSQHLNKAQSNDEISELGICETCREVNKPEEKELDRDGLTAQLIENITAPIQLLNPVEVPFTESNTILDAEFDPSQCAQISQITEETIESIHKQLASDMLDIQDTNGGKNNIKTYGFQDDKQFSNVVPMNDFIDNQYTGTLSEHDYKTNSNMIREFAENTLLFENIASNVSDDMKASFLKSQESTVILPRQMSVPTAPPEEDLDDTQSDETGIDVHSIEQDAKKDFPLFDEYVIEPSETDDDDKVESLEREKCLDIQEKDTFTNRIEKFKKLEEAVEVQRQCENFKDFQRNLQTPDVVTASSPALSMPSYFDTGNYAVDTHYRNSMILTTYNENGQLIPMRVPPGFEEEYQKKLIENTHRIIATNDDKKDIFEPFIPETSTQTKLSPTLTYTSAQKSVTENVSTVSQCVFSTSATNYGMFNPQELPNATSIFAGKEENVTKMPVMKFDTLAPSASTSVFGVAAVQESSRESKDDVSAASSTHLETETITKDHNIVASSKVPDPVDFFTSPVQLSTNDPQDNGFGRLASYFASPQKTDHSKSFFELSQSQNHHRHVDNNKQSQPINPNVQKDFFRLSQSQNHYIDKQYLANLKLMDDLTSLNNIELHNKDQVVRTINYFTVEYNRNMPKPFTDIGEPDTHMHKDLEVDNIKSNEVEPNLNKFNTELEEMLAFESTIKSCKYCSNIHSKINRKEKYITEINDFKLKKAMDTHEPDVKNKQEVSFEQTKNGSSGKSGNVTFDMCNMHDEANEEINTMFENRTATDYAPVKHHWFYRVDCDGKSIWRGFSMVDSVALENAFNSPDLNEHTLVPTDGGRFDVNVVGRLRIAVYWSDKPSNVLRCSWFYKGTTDARYIPYTEQVAEKLEEEYRHGVTTGEWHRRLKLANNEVVVMHGPQVMVHFLQGVNDPFATHNQSTTRPRVVRRGHDESEIEDPEPSSIDHLLLLCHGVGSACDMRFRSVEEVVDDFRATSLQLTQSHYKNSFDEGKIGRVEVLPISWHATLHSGEAGVDKRLAQITLDSIPRLRSFTNDTVLDVLFYTSPIFCQTIIDTVCKELNRVYKLFLARNPLYRGGVSLGGHSLGSVILYDLLCHQALTMNKIGSEKKLVSGSAGTGQLSVNYPQLEFSPSAMYALGSPIAIFECIRGVESLGKEFRLPTCKNFFNIFHPYDPIAYRIEPLINPELKNVKPHLIPHHKGRKRMHLELKDTMARVGADLKQKLVESIKATWASMWRSQPPSTGHLEKVVEEQLEKTSLTDDGKEDGATITNVSPEMAGALNGGRRVDYVLQEAPFEMINEYLFAMSSHVCYWESEDTMLLMLREIYDALGVPPDTTVPQQSMTVQRSRPVKEEKVYISTEHASTSRGPL